jgi:hypothetical protein
MRFFAVIFGLAFTISCGSGNKPADAGPGPGQPEAGVVLPTADAAATEAAPSAGLVCSKTLPCGGDPVGVWKIESICYSDDILDRELGAGEVARCNIHLGIQYDGMATYTFTADGISSTSFNGKAREEISMTEECMRSDKYAKMFDKGTNCSSSGGIRTCIMSGDSDSSVDAGTSSKTGHYTIGRNYIMTTSDQDAGSGQLTSDTLLFLTSRMQNPSSSTYGYCATGDTLTLSQGNTAFMNFVRVPGSPPSSAPPQVPAVSPVPVVAPTSVAPSYAMEPSCGGNLVGSWKITGIAVSDPLQDDILNKIVNFSPDGECVSKVTVAEEGTATFGDLNLWTGKCSMNEEPSLSIVYSAACLAPKTRTCDQLMAVHQADAPRYDPNVAVSCAPNADGDCACKISRKYSLDSCEYHTELGNYDYYSAGAPQSDYSMFLAGSHIVEYCVSGNTLKVINGDFAIYGFDGYATLTAERTSAPPTPVDLGTPGTCPTVTKCGGNIVGSWDITAVCLAPEAFTFTDKTLSWNTSNFSDSTKLWSCAKSMDVKGTGKAQFADTGSFSMSLALKMTAALDETCLAKRSTANACGAPMEQYLSFAYPGISCVSDTKGTCNCSYITRYADIGKATTAANSYGGVQSYKALADGTLEIDGQYESNSVTADFVTKLVDKSNPVDFGTLKVNLTNVGAYYCVQGDTLALYAGQLVNDMYLDISATRNK